MNPELPSLDLNGDELAYLAYELQRLRLCGPVVYFESLEGALRNLELSLGISLRRMSKSDRSLSINPAIHARIADVAMGMFSLAWQVKTGRALILDRTGRRKCSTKTQTPDT